MNPAPTDQPYSERHLAGAIVALLITVFLALPIFVPSLRGRFLWGDAPSRSMPMSVFGYFAWAFAAFAFCVTLAGEGFHIAVITHNAGRIFAAVFSILLVAWIIDSITDSKR